MFKEFQYKIPFISEIILSAYYSTPSMLKFSFEQDTHWSDQQTSQPTERKLCKFSVNLKKETSSGEQRCVSFSLLFCCGRCGTVVVTLGCNSYLVVNEHH